MCSLQVAKLKGGSEGQQPNDTKVKGRSKPNKGNKDGKDDPIDHTDNSDQFVTALPNRQLYPTLSNSETTPISSPAAKEDEAIPINVVLNTYKQGLQRGLLLGASPQPTTSLEQTLSQDVASFAATAVKGQLTTTSPRPSAPPLSALGKKRSLPSHTPPPPSKKEKLSRLPKADAANKHARSSSLASGLTALLRKRSPAAKQKQSWNPFRS